MRAAIGLLLCSVTFCHPTILSAAPDQPVTAAEKWDRRYARDRYVYGVEPVAFLENQISRLGHGRALCLAAGEGRNAVYLAQQGFDVVAVDISAKGLEKARRLAQEQGVDLQTDVADLNAYDMGQDQYDLITDFYYHDPTIFPKVMAALKPGGLFILQHFSIDQPATNRFGPRNPALLVKPNELLERFAQYRIRYYEDTVVDLDEGMHRGPAAVIRLIVEKSPAD